MILTATNTLIAELARDWSRPEGGQLLKMSMFYKDTSGAMPATISQEELKAKMTAESVSPSWKRYRRNTIAACISRCSVGYWQTDHEIAPEKARLSRRLSFDLERGHVPARRRTSAGTRG